MEQRKEPIISVIVPVFNVEHFLKECIDSIINQSIEELQIILIDDGSTDLSGQICDEYVRKDNRIEVIHQQNLGVSAARNAGLKVAAGRFITFVDSDDVLPENAYVAFMKKINVYNGLIMGRMQRISENGELLDKNSKFSLNEVHVNEYIYDLFEEKRFSYLGFLWDKMFLREIIEKNQLYFDTEIKLNEDRLFVLKYLLCIKKVSLCNEIVYYYRQRSSGVITETRRNITVTENEMTVLQSFQEMERISKKYSLELYFICCRKAFESALDLLNRVSNADKHKKRRLVRFLWENSIACISNPRYGISEKMKIIGHTFLQK